MMLISFLLSLLTLLGTVNAQNMTNSTNTTDTSNSTDTTNTTTMDPPKIEALLTEQVLNISVISAQLSFLAYENGTEWAKFDENNTLIGFEHPNYDNITFYISEPDAAIVARKGGRCYLAFRGTTVTNDDWDQNLDLRSFDAYRSNDTSTGEFCTVRRGYSDFLRTPVVQEASQELQECLATCEDPEDCLVITGHSQGGASAAVASIFTYDLMPTVVTFGMPPAVKSDCALIPSKRFYRWVNHKKEDGEEGDLGFDPVPFSPTFFSHSVHYGYYLLVGPDPSAAKFLGIDQNYTFNPDCLSDCNEIAAHTMGGNASYSYLSRMMHLYETGVNTSFPVSVNGFTDGTLCELSYRELCESGSCQNNSCAPPLLELCIKGSCEKDEDCAGGNVCVWDACATSYRGEIDGGCPCQHNYNCKSGDCDTKLTSLDWVCEYPTSSADGNSSANILSLTLALLVVGMSLSLM